MDTCSLDCGERMNCCFDEMDTVKRAENEGLVCTKMMVGVNSASNRRGVYMISSCPKKNDTDCGSDHVAAWGSLAPVYSPERERVYRKSTVLNAITHPSFEYTSMENNQLDQMSPKDSFIMFLSNNEVMTSEKLSDSQKYVRSVCTTKTEHSTCRPVFCPVLQRKQPDGTCGPSVVDVVGLDYEINLNFTLTPGMEIRLFRKLCEKVDNRNKRFPANFRSPWSRYWEVKNEVYYHIEKEMVVYFVVSLTRRNRGVALHKILENTANTMRTQWIIDGDEEIIVGQEFSSYSTFSLGQSSTPGNLTFIPFALEDVLKPEETIFGGLLNNHQFSIRVLDEIRFRGKKKL
ncbi:hypothetical protein MAR_018021 [Mya arenaria]|uniref:Uncharacterized protein n=1 Tax=Mya arenaria TaxID=6604 RepID=A0ABY7EHD0_MYAAR|nr:hypothetical protein MAR_018021 [Mya arenaria]